MVRNINEFAIVSVFCLAFAGCATQPLKTIQDRDRLAEAIGFKPNEIVFMNYCFFEEVQEHNSEDRLKGKRGIVAMTDSELCLVDGTLRKTPKDYFLKIPLSQIDGASNLDGLIQLKDQDRLIVLFLYNWNDFVPNNELSQKLYESLIFADVPGFEANDYYSFSRFKSPPKLIPYSQRKEPYDPYKFPDQ